MNPRRRRSKRRRRRSKRRRRRERDEWELLARVDVFVDDPFAVHHDDDPDDDATLWAITFGGHP